MNIVMKSEKIKIIVKLVEKKKQKLDKKNYQNTN